MMEIVGVRTPALFVIAPAITALFLFVWAHQDEVDEKLEALADRLLPAVATDAPPPPDAAVERRRAAWRARPSGVVRIGCWCMLAAYSVQLLTHSMAFYSASDAEVGKSSVRGCASATFRLAVWIAFLHCAASNPKLVVLFHRVVSVAMPLVHHLFGIWPKTGDKIFHTYLGGALIVNTIASCITTPSFSEMLVWRMGPLVMALMCSYETTPALQELSYFPDRCHGPLHVLVPHGEPVCACMASELPLRTRHRRSGRRQRWPRQGHRAVARGRDLASAGHVRVGVAHGRGVPAAAAERGAIRDRVHPQHGHGLYRRS